MAQEVELKLAAPPATVRKAADLPWLRALARGPAKPERLVSVYFDTPGYKLRRRGLALRVRHVGGKRLQTIKIVRKGGESGLGRGEWETEIAGTVPDLRLAKGTALAPLATAKLRRKLRPVFETVVTRVTLPVEVDGSTVELALDRGYLAAGAGREAISEIELELKSGKPAALAGIARRLGDCLALGYGPRPKQERGYALAAGEASGAVRAAPIMLEARASTAGIFRAVALACLDHALANARAVGQGDAEGVHQMRVGLRRLRATLSLFKPLIRGPDAEAVKADLKWLTEQLAPARDFDVLISESVCALREEAPEAETRVLAQDLEGKRNNGLDQARAAVDDERYRHLGLKTALWIIDGDWARGDRMTATLGNRRAADFAAEILDKRLRKIVKKANRIETLDPRRRHKLRIAVKKLRYATGFFADLFPGKKRRGQRARFARLLKALQSALGRLNDITVHRRIAHGIAEDAPARRRAAEALAMGFVAGHEQAEVACCIAAVAKSAKRLQKAARFWA